MLSNEMKATIEAALLAVQQRRWEELDTAIAAIRSARDPDAERTAIFVLKACAHQNDHLDKFMDAAEKFASDPINRDFVQKVVSAEFAWRSTYDVAMAEKTTAAFDAEASAAAIADALAAEAAAVIAALVERR
jgi:response regulator RpfG family c-di-GMP phosphodiesterase